PARRRNCRDRIYAIEGSTPSKGLDILVHDRRPSLVSRRLLFHSAKISRNFRPTFGAPGPAESVITARSLAASPYKPERTNAHRAWRLREARNGRDRLHSRACRLIVLLWDVR